MLSIMLFIQWVILHLKCTEFIFGEPAGEVTALPKPLSSQNKRVRNKGLEGWEVEVRKAE